MERDRRRAKVCIALFLATGWIAGASMALSQLVSEDLGRQANMFGVATAPVMLLAALYLYEKNNSKAARPWRGYTACFGLVWVGLCGYGLLIDNSIRVIILDTLTFACVLAAFWIGRRDEVWEDCKAGVIGLTGLSIVLALWNTDRMVLVDRGLLNEQAGAGFETGLILAPLFCMAAVTDRKTRRYYALLLLSAGCLFTYLFFGRRGISLRCGLEVLCGAAVLPTLLGMRHRAIVGIASVVLFVTGLWLYFPFETLTRRFQGNYGIIQTLTVDNERLIESRLMLEEFSDWEVLIGRGAGGAFLVNAPRSFVLDRIDDTRSGRVVLHAGFWLPFLKGGLLFQALYFLPLLILPLGVRRWRRLDPITKAAIIAGVILFAFQFTEGSPTYSTPWVAFGIGLIMSRAQNLNVRPQIVTQRPRPAVPLRRPAQSLQFPDRAVSQRG